jgi:hypothetical protein
MTTQRGPKHKKPAAKADKEATVANKKTRVEAKVKETATPRLDEPPAESPIALRAAQTEVEHERPAPIKAEKAETEAQEGLAATPLEIEQERRASARRVSFVVRLTVNEHGQVQRTEIQHVESDRRQNFPSLDGERLVAFMRESISPTNVPEHDIPPAPPPQRVETPTPGPLNLESSLNISSVQVFRLEVPDVMALTLNREEGFVVEARFQLQGSAVPSLGARGSPYEMKVYVSEVTSGKSRLLTTYNATLIQDVLEYAAKAYVSGLPSGLYRLFTLVTVGEPREVAGHYDGPVIRVI